MEEGGGREAGRENEEERGVNDAFIQFEKDGKKRGEMTSGLTDTSESVEKEAIMKQWVEM